jgi:uridine kinase
LPPQREVIAERIDNHKKVEATKIIILEGSLALQFPELCEMADLKIFCDASPDLRLLWKIKRSPYFKKMIGEEAKGRRNFANSRNKGDRGFVESIILAFHY